MALPNRIVLVCSGNTCRSSMAEAMLRKALADEFGGAAGGVSVISAGVCANEGDPASPDAIAVMREFGLDIASHRARRLREELVRDADLVLTMTLAHKRTVLSRYPSLEDRVMTLNEFAGLSEELGLDTPDPFGGGIEVYRAAARDIGTALGRVVDRIGAASEKDRGALEGSSGPA